MNVYDFDGTIYSGDSTVDFYLYALKHKPSLLCYLPKQLFGGVLFTLKQIDKTKFKEFFFCFLRAIDAENMAESFWSQHQDRIYDWYLNQQEPNDIIISASPEFLLKPISYRLGINCLVASKVDPHSGLFTGENCYGQEKVQRLQEVCNLSYIDKFFSDSCSDLPLARIASKAFLVKKGKVAEWTEI